MTKPRFAQENRGLYRAETYSTGKREYRGSQNTFARHSTKLFDFFKFQTKQYGKNHFTPKPTPAPVA